MRGTTYWIMGTSTMTSFLMPSIQLLISVHQDLLFEKADTQYCQVWYSKRSWKPSLFYKCKISQLKEKNKRQCPRSSIKKSDPSRHPLHFPLCTVSLVEKKLIYSLVNIIGESGVNTLSLCAQPNQMYFLLKMLLKIAKSCTRHLLFVSGTL